MPKDVRVYVCMCVCVCVCVCVREREREREREVLTSKDVFVLPPTRAPLLLSLVVLGQQVVYLECAQEVARRLILLFHPPSLPPCTCICSSPLTGRGKNQHGRHEVHHPPHQAEAPPSPPNPPPLLTFPPSCPLLPLPPVPPSIPVLIFSSTASAFRARASAGCSGRQHSTSVSREPLRCERPGRGG